MPRVRQDNDARYALRASFVDQNGDVLDGPIVIGGSSNDPRISDTDIANWNTAYGWGNHASEGYWVDGSSTLNATSIIKCGTDSSSPVGFTVNDGGGNANIVFNHFSNATTTAGANTARIAHNSDGTTNSNLTFRTGTGGAAPTERLRVDDEGIDVTGALTVTQGATISGTVTAAGGITASDSVVINQNGSLTATWDTEAALQVKGSYGGGVAWLDGTNGGWLGYVYNAGNNFVLAQATASASPSKKFEINQLGDVTLAGSKLTVSGSSRAHVDLNATSSDWSYVKLAHNGSTAWDIGSNGSSSHILEFRPDGGDTNKITMADNGRVVANEYYSSNSTYYFNSIFTYLYHDGTKYNLKGGDVEVKTGGVSFASTGANQAYFKFVGGEARRLTTQGGLVVGVDSSVVLHAGDRLNSIKSTLGITDGTTAETLYATADGSVYVSTNHQTAGSEYNWVFGNNGAFYLAGGSSATAWGPVSLNGQTGVMRVNNSSGYVDVGCANTSYCHFQTDRPAFYFNKRVESDGNFQFYQGTTIGNGTNGGDYGSVYIDGNAKNSYEGYSIGGRAVFMHNNGTTTGIYNDVNNQWIMRGIHNERTEIFHAGNIKGYTYSSGWRVTGNLLATGDVYAYFSDERLKDVSGAIESPLEKISALHGVYYTHNEKARELGYEGSERQVGLIAQEVQAVLPEVIGRAPVDDDGEGGSVTGEDYITVNYQRIVPLLVEGIKELTSELEAVKLELKELRDGSA